MGAVTEFLAEGILNVHVHKKKTTGYYKILAEFSRGPAKFPFSNFHVSRLILSLFSSC